MILWLTVRILIRACWTWTWHSVIATNLRNTTLNSTRNSSGNQHSGSLVSKNLTAKTQYGIKGNFFVNHFSFIINCHIYISSVSVLDYKCLISPEFQRFFRYMLLRKPLIHLRNVCLEFFWCCVLVWIVIFRMTFSSACSWALWTSWTSHSAIALQPTHLKARHSIALRETSSSTSFLHNYVIFIYLPCISSISVFLTFHFARLAVIFIIIIYLFSHKICHISKTTWSKVKKMGRLVELVKWVGIQVQKAAISTEKVKYAWNLLYMHHSSWWTTFRVWTIWSDP